MVYPHPIWLNYGLLKKNKAVEKNIHLLIFFVLIQRELKQNKTNLYQV